MAPEIQALQLTLSGDPTVTVDGRVAASWAIRDDVLEVTPHVDLSRAQRKAIREEALRTARFCGAQAVNGPLEREKPPRGGLYGSISASGPKNLSPIFVVGALPLI